MDYIKDIEELLSEHNKFKNEDWIIKNFPNLHFFINNLYEYNISWKEKLYLHINKLSEPPICYCGSKLKFKSINLGYQKYCSKKCLSNHPETKIKRKKTSQLKFGTDNPMQNKKIKENYKNTIIEKYGVDNLSKSQLIKAKKENTLYEKYGFKYNSQREDIKLILKNKLNNNRQKINNKIKNKLVDYLSDKLLPNNIKFIDFVETSVYKLECSLGHHFQIHKNVLNDRIRNLNTICTVCNPINNDSDYQNQLLEFIESIYDGNIIKNDRTLIGKELDIYLPQKKLAFEFNGVFWHSEKFKDKDYHLQKTNQCEEKNVHLIHIWEDDWIYKCDIIKSRIKNLLGTSNKIWARNCKISEISHNECRDFLIENHINGYVVSKYRIGLFHNGKLVSIMAFGALRISLGQKSKTGEYELLRFCNKLDFSVIGGASKLLKFFIRNYNPQKIISYADRCWSQGNLYRRLGFHLESFTKPNYYWVVNGIRKNRFNFRKSILISEGYDPKMSESEIMHYRGYFRIFDCGNIKYIYSY